jgi:hypothetical protein
MNGPNVVVLTCLAVSLSAAVALAIRTRNLAWIPAFAALMIFSVYELWQASGQMFIYVDDGRDVPTWLHVTKDFGLIGLAVGVLGPVVISLRWANSKFDYPRR